MDSIIKDSIRELPEVEGGGGALIAKHKMIIGEM